MRKGRCGSRSTESKNELCGDAKGARFDWGKEKGGACGAIKGHVGCLLERADQTVELKNWLP